MNKLVKESYMAVFTSPRMVKWRYPMFLVGQYRDGDEPYYVVDGTACHGYGCNDIIEFETVDAAIKYIHEVHKLSYDFSPFAGVLLWVSDNEPITIPNVEWVNIKGYKVGLQIGNAYGYHDLTDVMVK